MISNEMLEQVAKLDVEFLTFPPNHAQVAEMARELLALRKAFETPDCWEIAGNIFSTKEEALKPGFIGQPEPLYSKPEFLE